MFWIVNDQPKEATPEI